MNAAAPDRSITGAIEFAPISALAKAARNARLHSPEQIEQIAASIREFRWTYPVLVDEDGRIIAGHGRVLAAEIIYRDEDAAIETAWGAVIPRGMVPILRAIGWSDVQKRAYALADNKLPLNAAWDANLLKLELGDLRVVGFDLAPIGFSVAEIDKMFAALSPPSEFPEFGDDIDTEHECPRCHYVWSGKNGRSKPDET